ILTELGSLLSRELRSADILARINGGKFAALLPQTKPEQARAVCERFQAALATHAFPNHREGELTISIGYADYPGGNLESVDELFNGAEACLDRAKQQGPSR